MTAAGGSAAQHWCVRIALKAGWLGASELNLPANTGVADAWAAVTAACGISEDTFAAEIARNARLPVADWANSDARATRLIPERVARKFALFPLREDDRSVWVASSDPNDMGAEQEVGFASGRRPRFEVASPATIRAALDAGYAPEDAMATLLAAAGTDMLHAIRVAENAGPEAVRAEEAAAAPIVGLANLILHDGVKRRASDIHIEPGRKTGVVRFRVDGLMHEYLQLQMPVFNRVVSRIKVMGDLDIADRMRPQDGRSRIQLSSGKTVDLRLSTVPTRDSEKIVIRILDAASTRKLHEVGLPAPELARIQTLISYRDGIVLLTGPTGSGKTTTLYGALQDIATGDVNITTIEDPVEYEVAGITQIQVETKRGVTFASSLRAVLRQDPDVIFVGEIRDADTAQTAAHAALTGHLVLSTLHTNDAIGVIARMTDLGLDRPTIATSLRGAAAQRLVRRLCPACSVPATDPLSADEKRLLALTGVRPAKRTAGCEKCAHTGFLGRMAVAEVLVVSPEIAAMIAAGDTAAAILQRARREGMRILSEVALDAVRSGDTTLQEVERVVGFTDLTATTAKPRCLIVDDDPVLRQLATALLTREGIDIIEAPDADTALAVIRSAEPPQLVILDIGLPGMDGRALLRVIRSEDATRRLPVVILTGSEDERLEPELMDEGADDYLRKPVDPPRFVARIKAVLRRAAQR
jgi:type II secretory ATPase GspE/PulE/Tfp pilus assembly ATPase PilB-like protein/ActR/RegA family two-component response regulator